jgi:putative acetyltransferase
MDMQVRVYRDSDISQIVSLFYDTVHTVNAKDYTQEQLDAWAHEDERAARLTAWGTSLRHNITYVAEMDGRIVGFADLTHAGKLDRLYVHKDHQGQGIATALVQSLESTARSLGIQEIFTEASITAKPFFERHGYQTLHSQTVERRNTTLMNYKMSKILGHAKEKTTLVQDGPTTFI